MLQWFKLLFFVIITAILASCISTENLYTANTIENFPDVLNVKNIPDKAEDWSAFCFSDLGAWQGYALPPDTMPQYWGGFSGPFLMTQGRWLRS